MTDFNLINSFSVSLVNVNEFCMAVILAGFSLSKWIPNGFMHRHTQCATFFSSSEYNTVAEKWMPAKQLNTTTHFRHTNPRSHYIHTHLICCQMNKLCL